MPIASVVSSNSKNEKIDQLSMLTTEKLSIENQRLMWSLVRNSKNEKIDQLSMLTTEKLSIENQRLMWSLVRMLKK